MQRYLLILGLIASLPIQGHTQTERHQQNVQIQHYDRFWRLSLRFPSRPIYTAVDQSQQGRLLVAFAMDSLPRFTIPVHAALDLQIRSGDTLFISWPTRFKFDAFYFPPGRKLVFDFYPVYPQSSPAETYLQARQKLASGDTSEAIRLFRLAYMQDPSNAQAMLSLAKIFLKQNHIDRAQALFQQLKNTRYPDMQDIALTYLQLIEDIQHEAQSVDEDSLAKEAGTLRYAQADSLPEQPAAENPSQETAKKDTTAAATATQARPAANRQPRPIIVSRRKISRSWFEEASKWFNAVPAGYFAMLLLFPLLTVAFFWLKSLRKPGRGRKSKVSRILRLMEQNKLQQKKREIRQKVETGRSAERRVNIVSDEEAAPSLTAERLSKDNSGGTAAAAGSARFSDLLKARREEPEKRATEPASPAELPYARKREILRMALQGLSVRQIAKELQIGVGEVELALGLGKAGREIDQQLADDQSLDFGA